MKDYLDSLEKLELHKVIARLEGYAATDLGKKQIRQLRPLASWKDIQVALDMTSEMKTLLETDVPPPFDGVVDIGQTVHRALIADNVISAQELRHVADFLLASRQLKSFFSKRREAFPLLSNVASGLVVDKVLEFNITRAIDEKGSVRDDATKELLAIRTKIAELGESLKDRLSKILRAVVHQGWGQDEIITTREGRLVIPVKVEHKQHVPGFIHSTSSSGATVFIEPAETLEMNNEVRSLQFQEQREIERVLRDLTEQVRVIGSSLLNSAELIALLDLNYTKAKFSIAVIGARPAISESGRLVLKEGRHPLLLQQFQRDKVVPLDVELGDDYHTLIITGPNAGGKTVALKAIGLLAAMAHSGLHIPASPDSEIPLFGKLFVDIGDEQSIERNLSTFSSHVEKLQVITEEADEHSLVLIDEIAAGTDPAEGSALASAVLETLTARRSYTVATTHNSILKAFAFEAEGIENASMEFDQQSLLPTYNLRIGLPGSSYALEIAHRLGIAADIIARAHDYLGEKAHKLEQLLIALEKQQQELQQKQVVTRAREERLTELITDYEAKLNSLQREVGRIKREALEEAAEIVRGASSLVEKTVKEIRQQQASKTAISSFKREQHQLLTQLSTQMDSETRKEVADVDIEFKIGDVVKLKSSNELGEIIDIIGRNHFTVLAGVLKIKADKSMLLKVVNEKIKQRVTPSSFEISGDMVKEVDLRGMAGDEAITAVDKLIDSAILAGFASVRLIHGKGTGALRKRVSEHLKKHPQVSSFRLGEGNEGGTGVTIVELR